MSYKTTILVKMPTRLQFAFEVVASPRDEKSNIIIITTITTEDGKTYVIPEELRAITNHTELKNTETYIKLKNSIKRRHQKKKIWFVMTENLKEVYMDEGNNIQFAEQFLDEIEEEKQENRAENQGLNEIFEKFLRTTQKKENQQSLKRITENFIIEKFTCKNANAKYWLETFEKECKRFDIEIDETKIEILRLFLEGSCLNWYNSMIIKEGIESE